MHLQVIGQASTALDSSPEDANCLIAFRFKLANAGAACKTAEKDRIMSVYSKNQTVLAYILTIDRQPEEFCKKLAEEYFLKMEFTAASAESATRRSCRHPQ